MRSIILTELKDAPNLTDNISRKHWGLPVLRPRGARVHALDDAGPQDLLQQLQRLLLGDVLAKVGVLFEALVQPVDGFGAAEAVFHRLHADPVPLGGHARVEGADDLVPEPGGAPGAADHAAAAVRHVGVAIGPLDRDFSKL